MNAHEFIDSGMLETYCLGLLDDEDEEFVIQMSLLYAEVKNEMTKIELALEAMANANAVEPPARLKQTVLSAFESKQAELPSGFTDLPLISQHSDYKYWNRVVAHLVPETLEEDFFCRVLRNDDNVTQMLVVTKTDVAPETHDDLSESFLILKGTCRCNIGGRTIELTEGGYVEIPLFEEHDIRVLSPYVVAVLQYMMP